MPPFLKQAIVRTTPTLPVFKYIPKSHCEDGESLISECSALKSITKPISNFKVIDSHVLENKGVLPPYKSSQTKVAGAPHS